MTEKEIMDDFFETTSFDEERDWRAMPELGEGDDDEDDEPRGLGSSTSGYYGHTGGAGGPGNPGGSNGQGSGGGEVSIVKKAKAPPATKDQIDTAVKMKANGASYAEIQTETGLNPKQAATIIFKHKKAVIAAKEALAMSPAEIKANFFPSAVPSIAESDQMKADGYLWSDEAKGWVKGPKFSHLPEKSGQADADAAKLAKGELPSWSTEGQSPTTPLAPHGALLGKGYEWKEKTTGPAKGKYAYFKDGVQVSANAPKDEWQKASATINFGKGPDYVAPKPPPKPGSYKGSDLIADVVGKVEESKPWPITDDVVRRKGTTTYQNVRKTGEELETKLTVSERAAIKDYTGAGSHSMNAALRSGKTPEKTKVLDSALQKAVPPPPPDLVWRGVPSVKQHSLIQSLESGDVIRLASYQSTSISPDKANSWSSGQTLFEIRPTKGAYVGTISTHPESEYLLPRGAHYRVRGATTVMIGHQKRQVIQLEMLP